MGGTSNSNQQQTSQVDPGLGTSGALTGILGRLGGMAPSAGTLTGAQQGAINQLTANGQAGDPNAAGMTAGVKGLLSGGNATQYDPNIEAAYKQYQGILNPYANGSNIGSNSALRPQLDQIATDTKNSVDSQFAASGRDGSPDNYMALGRGIAAGEAPVLANQFNIDQGNQLSAAGNLYNGANSTYGILNGTNATRNANIGAGVAAAPGAYNETNAGANNVLNAQSMINGIPISQLTTLLGSISPVAQAFGKQNGTASGSNTMSGAQQFATIAGGIGSMMPKAPLSLSFG